MNVLNNTKLAAFVAAVLIVFSILFGSNRSLSDLSSKAEKVFYHGEFNDGFSIQNDLNERIDLAYNLVTVAKRYLDTNDAAVEAVLSARDELIKAKTVSQKSIANKHLTEAAADLNSKLEKAGLSETDEKLRKRHYNNMTSRNDTISHDRYNQFAEDFNKTLQAFPANILSKLTGVAELDRFD